MLTRSSCVAYGRKPFPSEIKRGHSVASSASSDLGQPLGTTTELRNTGSARDLADMIRKEMPDTNLAPPRIHIDCENTQPDIFPEKLEAESSTPSSDHSSKGWS
jgi:hypothetical protein